MTISKFFMLVYIAICIPLLLFCALFPSCFRWLRFLHYDLPISLFTTLVHIIPHNANHKAKSSIPKPKKRVFVECVAIFTQVIVCFWAFYLPTIPDSKLLQFLLCLFPPKEIMISSDHAELFITVYATIFMSHTALWALMTGASEKEFAGIYYADYLMNLKPIFYKQRFVFFTALGMLLGSYLCYVRGWYNMIVAFLVCEIVFIAVSTVFIYDVLVGNKYAIKKEMRQFSVYNQLRGHNHERA